MKATRGNAPVSLSRAKVKTKKPRSSSHKSSKLGSQKELGKDFDVVDTSDPVRLTSSQQVHDAMLPARSRTSGRGR